MRVTPPPVPVPRLMVANSRIDVAVADHQFGAFARELLVLRIAADRGVAVDVVVAPDARRAVTRAVRADDGAVADLDVRRR